MMEEYGKAAEKWLYGLSKGQGHELEARTLEGIYVEHSRDGLVRCKFIIPQHLADEDGYWHIGAMAVLIDDVAAAAIHSVVGHIKVSVCFDISYPSRAKVQEEVEIEAKVCSHNGKLTLVEVRVKKSSNRELVACAKEWMSSVGGSGTTPKIRRTKL